MEEEEAEEEEAEEMNLRFEEEDEEELNRREEEEEEGEEEDEEELNRLEEEDEEEGEEEDEEELNRREEEEEEGQEEEMDRRELCVDLSEAYGEHRTEVVKAMRKACCTRGFFWVVNHGIPLRVMEDLISAVRSFHEQPIGPKCFYYVRDLGFQNYYYSSPLLPLPSDDAPLIWRDTLNVPLGPHPPALKQIPGICKKQVLAWDVYVRRMGKVLMELLSEGLGLTRMRLEEFSCLEGRHLAAHCYPTYYGLLRGCSDLVVGPTTDPCVINVLLHDHDDLTTLELKVGEHWQELHLEMPGCLMVTVGDVLQMISNDEYKSVVHRVVAEDIKKHLVSIELSFNPTLGVISPLQELLSTGEPAHYIPVRVGDFMRRSRTENDVKSFYRNKRLENDDGN